MSNLGKWLYERGGITNYPTVCSMTLDGIASGNNNALTLDLYGVAKSMEIALRAVADTCHFHDMPDSVQEMVNDVLNNKSCTKTESE